MFLTKDQNPSRSFNVSILSPEQRRNSYFGEGGGRWRINRHVCRRRFGASVLVEENKTIQVEWSRRGFNERVFLPFFCRREKRGRRIGGRRLVIRCKQHLYSSATFWSVRSPPLLLMLTIYLLILPSELSDTTTRSAPNGHHHFSTTSKGLRGSIYIFPLFGEKETVPRRSFSLIYFFSFRHQHLFFPLSGEIVSDWAVIEMRGFQALHGDSLTNIAIFPSSPLPAFVHPSNWVLRQYESILSCPLKSAISSIVPTFFSFNYFSLFRNFFPFLYDNNERAFPPDVARNDWRPNGRFFLSLVALIFHLSNKRISAQDATQELPFINSRTVPSFSLSNCLIPPSFPPFWDKRKS